MIGDQSPFSLFYCQSRRAWEDLCHHATTREGKVVAQLVVEPEKLETAAQHSDEAAEKNSKLKVADDLSKVGNAVRGGDSGDAAAKAGDHLDLLSKRLGDGLKAFSEAVRAAKNEYGETDYSTSVDFKGFRNAIEGKE